MQWNPLEKKGEKKCKNAKDVKYVKKIVKNRVK